MEEVRKRTYVAFILPYVGSSLDCISITSVELTAEN